MLSAVIQLLIKKKWIERVSIGNKILKTNSVFKINKDGLGNVENTEHREIVNIGENAIVNTKYKLKYKYQQQIRTCEEFESNINERLDKAACLFKEVLKRLSDAEKEIKALKEEIQQLKQEKKQSNFNKEYSALKDYARFGKLYNDFNQQRTGKYEDAEELFRLRDSLIDNPNLEETQKKNVRKYGMDNDYAMTVAKDILQKEREKLR